jgi:hypothetical protein
VRLWDENGVVSPERLPGSETAHLRPPVFGATVFRSVRCASTGCRGGLTCVIGGGPAATNSCCALGCVESYRSRSWDERAVTREDIVEVSVVGTGQDLAASEIVQECYEGIETEAHSIKGRE